MLVRKNNTCLVTGLEDVILSRMIILTSDDFSLTQYTHDLVSTSIRRLYDVGDIA